MPSAFAKTSCNTGNGDCEVSVKVLGQCKLVTVNYSGATGDNCYEPGNNEVENIKFRCKLLGGKMKSMVMTKSLLPPDPEKPDCSASDKVREQALAELKKEHKGATDKAKEDLRIEAGSKLAALKHGQGEAAGGTGQGSK